MHHPTIKDIVSLLEKQKRSDDIELIVYAYEFAERAHRGQTRASGAPYIEHSVATAHLLTSMHLDTNTIIAGLLHDVVEDTDITFNELKKEFGEEVSHLVQGVTKLGQIKYRGIERYAENLRKMFLAMAQDIRIIFIKFADRIHNLHTLEFLPIEKQKRIATESLEIYGSIANRLGMGALKSEIERLSFPYVYPEEYKITKKLFDTVIDKNKSTLEKTQYQIQKLLDKNNIHAIRIEKRRKGIYSLYKKLYNKKLSIDEIYDLNAIRIITDTSTNCYQILGILHSKWKPLPGRIKDYIALPKPNGYQSLHTTVFAENNQITEIQIRTIEMHEQAEFGIASHWHYKESGHSLEMSSKMDWIKDLLSLQKDIANNSHYLKHIKLDIFRDRIFVFTPTGDVIDLPDGATVLDFAYAVHSELGDKCERGKINGKLVSLDMQLKSGEMVEIQINKNRKKPNLDWLKFAKTHKAHNRIRQAHGINAGQTTKANNKKSLK